MRKILILVVVMSFIFFLAGCKQEANENSSTLGQEKFTDINYKIGYQNMNMHIDYFGEKFDIVLIHSVDELSNLSNQKIDFLSKYDSDFFEKNSLIIYNIHMKTSGNEITETNILKDNDKIYIKLNLKYGYMDALSNGVIIIEVLKTDCENIKSVETIKCELL